MKIKGFIKARLKIFQIVDLGIEFLIAISGKAIRALFPMETSTEGSDSVEVLPLGVSVAT